MTKIEHSVLINRPVDEVFGFVTDFERLPQCAAEVVEVGKASTRPMDVGTTFAAAVRFLGRRIESVHEITEYEPKRKFRFIQETRARGWLTLDRRLASA